MATVEQITTIRSNFDPTGIEQGLARVVGAVKTAAESMAQATGATDQLTRQWLSAANSANALATRLDGQSAALANYTRGFNTMMNALKLGAVQSDVAATTLDRLQQKLGLVRGALDANNAALATNSSIGLTSANNFKRLVDLFDPFGAATIRANTAINNLNQAQTAGVQIMGGYAGALASVTAAQERASIAGIGLAEAAQETIIALKAAAVALDQYQAGLDATRTRGTATFDPVTASAQRMVAELQFLNAAVAAGVNIAGGYEAAYQAIIDKYDEGAVAAKNAAAAAAQLAEQNKQAAQTGRAGFSQDQNQQNFTQFIASQGTTGPRGQGALGGLNQTNSARESAGAFTDEFQKQADAIDAANAALDRYLAEMEAGMAELDKFNQTSSANRARWTAEFDPLTDSAMRMVMELQNLNAAQAAGINIAGGYAAAYQAIIDKYDEGAVAAKNAAAAAAQLAEQNKQAVQAGRAGFSQDQNQQNFTQFMASQGTTGPQGQGALGGLNQMNSARGSAGAFTDEFQKQADAIDAANAALDRYLKRQEDLAAENAGLETSFNSIKTASLAYETELTRLDTYATRTGMSTEQYGIELDKLNQKMLGSAGTAKLISDAEAAASAATKALADDNARLTASLDPLTTAYQVYRKTLQDIATAQARGVITPGVANQASETAAANLKTAQDANGPTIVAAKAQEDENQRLINSVAPLRQAQEKLGQSYADIDAAEVRNILTDKEADAQRTIATRTYNTTASTIDKMNKSTGNGIGLTGGLTREFIVLGHEISQGNWSRFGGSIAVMVEYLSMMDGVVGKTIAFFKTVPGMITIGVVGLVAGIGLLIASAQSAATRVGELKNVLSVNRTDFATAAPRGEQVARNITRNNPTISLADSQASVDAILKQGDIFTGSDQQIAKLVVLNQKLSAVLEETTVDTKRVGQLITDPAGVLQSVLNAKPNNGIFDQNAVNQIKGMQDNTKTLGEAVDRTFTLLDTMTRSVKIPVTELGASWSNLVKEFTLAEDHQKSLTAGFGSPFLTALIVAIDTIALLVHGVKLLISSYDDLLDRMHKAGGNTGSQVDFIQKANSRSFTTNISDLAQGNDLSTGQKAPYGVNWFTGAPNQAPGAVSGAAGGAAAFGSDSNFWRSMNDESNTFWTFAKDSVTKTSGDTWTVIKNFAIASVWSPFQLVVDGFLDAIHGILDLLHLSSPTPGGGAVPSTAGSGTGTGLAPAPVGSDRALATVNTKSPVDVQNFVTAFLQNQDQIKLNDAGIAAILANIQHEGGFGATATGWGDTDGKSYGMFQYRGDRLSALQSASGTLTPDILQQLQFMLMEITQGVKASVGQTLTSLPNTYAGAFAGSQKWTTGFEVPANAQAVALQRAPDVARYLPDTVAHPLAGAVGDRTPSMIVQAANTGQQATVLANQLKLTQELKDAQDSYNIELAKGENADPSALKKYQQQIVNLNKSLFETVTASDAAFRSLGYETTAAGQIAAAWQKGSVAAADATIKTQAMAQATQVAGRTGEEYSRILPILTQMLTEKKMAEEAVGLGQANSGLKDQIQLVEKEISTYGMDANQREVVLAGVKQEIALRAQFPELYKAHATVISENIKLTEDQIKKQQELKLNTQATEEVAGQFGTAFTAIGSGIVDAFDSGKTAAQNFQTTMTTIVKQILNEFLKLAVINPLLNDLFPSTAHRTTLFDVNNMPGTSTTTTTGGVGNTSGGLFGSFFNLFKSSGSTSPSLTANDQAFASGSSTADLSQVPVPPIPPPVSVNHAGWLVGSGAPPASRYVHPAYFDHAPRFHSGTADELPAVLQRGETVLSQFENEQVMKVLNTVLGPGGIDKNPGLSAFLASGGPTSAALTKTRSASDQSLGLDFSGGVTVPQLAEAAMGMLVGKKPSAQAMAAIGLDPNGNLANPSHPPAWFTNQSGGPSTITPQALSALPVGQGGLAHDEFPAILQRGERVLTASQHGQIMNLMDRISGSSLPTLPPGITGLGSLAAAPRLHSGLGGDEMLNYLQGAAATALDAPQRSASAAPAALAPANVSIQINAPNIKTKQDVDTFRRTVPQQMALALQAAGLTSVRNTGH